MTALTVDVAGPPARAPAPDAAARAYHPAARAVAAPAADAALPAHRRAAPTYLPTLFDRLQDDEPSQPHESPDVYAPGRERMRALIRRDLALLLGTVNQEDRIDRARYPHAAGSTLNFGLPPLAGSWSLARRWWELEAMIRRALADFEPRLAPGSLRVTPLHSPHGADVAREPHLLRFEISGEVHLSPYPLAFRVQTAVDLETSRISLEDQVT
ncbi:MAG: type VI secretion system baseplate subunit TssE [Burkholderiales bacterium]|nr:type VI secretion system baseplate subunit TssE [Burkholderiales bacterium]